MKKIGMGVIGAGIMGDYHARVYSELEKTQLIAVADLVEERAKKLAKKYGARKIYTDYQKLIDDSQVEAVSVATPDFAHFRPVIGCLEAGKHVLVEKPLTTDLEEANKIIESARGSRAKLMVNYSHRWLPAYFQAHQVIEEGKIGEPVMSYTRKNDTIYVPTKMLSWAEKSSPAMFLSAHDIDLVRWYIKSEVEEVYANAVFRVLKNRGINAPDCIQAQVKFKNGAIATFESAWIYPDTFPTMTDSFIEIVGTKGVIHLERKEEQMEIATEKSFQHPRNLLTFPIFGKLQGAFSLSLTHFVESILEDSEPYVSGEEGREVTRILCAIHKSIEKGEPVKLLSFSK